MNKALWDENKLGVRIKEVPRPRKGRHREEMGYNDGWVGPREG